MLLFAVGFLLCQGAQGLKDVRIYVPSAVVRGQNAILQCHYDLEGDLLYAVKWYKGRREFFRYTPRESPPIKQFRIAGLRVKEDASNDTHVVLENVSRDNSGPFSCEISADAPSFYTGIETGVLEVVDPPKNDPFITGLKTRYRLEEVLKANCTSGESRPAANLTWYVNGRPSDTQHVHRHRPHPTFNGEYETAHSQLRLQITKKLFTKGRLKIRCVASMHDVYYRSLEKTVELERKKYRTFIPEVTTMSAKITTQRPPDIVWESAILPPERYPDTTLIFTSPINSGGQDIKISDSSSRKLLLLLCCVTAIFLNAVEKCVRYQMR